jgi:hypothetical protein
LTIQRVRGSAHVIYDEKGRRRDKPGGGLEAQLVSD